MRSERRKKRALGKARAIVAGTVPVMSVSRFERFFREAASLHVDKDDLKRYSEFVNRKIRDLLLVGQATATANNRDVIEPRDLPITVGLERTLQEFRRINEQIELEPILAELATYPPLDVSLSVETEARLPVIVGGLSIALARTFKIIEPDLPNPQSRHWERAFQIFDLLL
jgi:hypothetical protein